MEGRELGLSLIGLLALAPPAALLLPMLATRRTHAAAGALVGTGLLVSVLAMTALTTLQQPTIWSGAVPMSLDVRHADDFPLALHVRLDAVGCVMLTAIGIGFAVLGGLTSESAAGGSRAIALGLLTVAVWYWLVDTVWVAVILQGVLLAISFLLLGVQRDHPASGGQARSLWLTVTCSDVAFVLVAIGWHLEAGITTFSDAESREIVEQVVTRSPAIVSALGALIWIGSLGRMLQFPMGLTCDQARQPSGLPLGTVVLLCLGSIGWRWLSTGQPWFLASIQTENLIAGGSALGAGIAAWFAICSTDPRIRTAWLTTIPGAVSASNLLAAHETSRWVSLLTMSTGMLAAAWLFGMWVSTPSPTANDELPMEADSPETLPMFSFMSWSGGRVTSGEFRGRIRESFGVFRSDVGRTNSEQVPDQVVARGGRLAVLAGVVALLLPPLLLGPWGDVYGRSTGGATNGSESAVGTDRVDDYADAETPRSTWPEWARLAAVGWSAVAATLLVAQTQSMSADKVSVALLCVAGLTLFLPWTLISTPELAPARAWWNPPADRVLWGFVAAACGVAIGVIECRRSANAPRRTWLETGSRLGHRRLYLSSIALFGVNLPVRALAQLTRFLDWFAWETVVLGTLTRLPRLGVDAEVDLHRSEPGFYALSLCVGLAAVALTLMWLGQ